MLLQKFYPKNVDTNHNFPSIYLKKKQLGLHIVDYQNNNEVFFIKISCPDKFGNIVDKG